MRVLLLVVLLSVTSFAAKKCETCARDSHGKIQRSQAAKREFRRTHPCPGTGLSTGTCPGYRIDHVIALCRGGKDSPSNMAYQAVADAKAKDKIECK